jgi:hypothetical protein
VGHVKERCLQKGETMHGSLKAAVTRRTLLGLVGLAAAVPAL